MSISLSVTIFLSHVIFEIVDKSEEFTKKNKIMNTILIGVSSIFIVSFCILSLLETTSDADIWAVNFNALDNKSLSSLNPGNGNETLVLDGATLIDGNGGPQKADSVIVIGDSKRIVAITNQTNFRDNSALNNDSNGSQSNERVLNLTGKYTMPGLFDMHAHIAGVRKNSYDQAMSKNMLGMLLDYGVTTVRNPGGPTNETVR
ncbi:MAG: hypothetical protein ACRD4W_03760, partial [Nitrososphaeraceae archaeon]